MQSLTELLKVGDNVAPYPYTVAYATYHGVAGTSGRRHYFSALARKTRSIMNWKAFHTLI